MFVILNIKASGKRRIKKGKTVGTVREQLTYGNEKFYIADIFDSAAGVNWNEAAAFLGRHGKRVLLSRSLILPENCPLKRFSAEKYRNVLVFNSVTEIIRQLYSIGERIHCCIYDPNGAYVFMMPKIAEYAAKTTVVTNSPVLYDSAVFSIYKQTGAGITVTDSKCSLFQGDIVIDTSGLIKSDEQLVFSISNNGCFPKHTEGFNDLKSMCPPYIDPLDFLGAMYELNREYRLSRSAARVFLKDEKAFTLSELAALILNRQKKLSYIC